ncbi:MAG TPA: hypothetical protein VMZ71_13975 [Gemmataceae bacterium]|nr:hypothetical protein [Gemmataceae bacterium]
MESAIVPGVALSNVMRVLAFVSPYRVTTRSSSRSTAMRRVDVGAAPGGKDYPD